MILWLKTNTWNAAISTGKTAVACCIITGQWLNALDTFPATKPCDLHRYISTAKVWTTSYSEHKIPTESWCWGKRKFKKWKTKHFCDSENSAVKIAWKKMVLNSLKNTASLQKNNDYCLKDNRDRTRDCESDTVGHTFKVSILLSWIF